MWGLIFTAGAVIVLALFPAVRCAVFHPLHVLYYGTLDTFGYIHDEATNDTVWRSKLNGKAIHQPKYSSREFCVPGLLGTDDIEALKALFGHGTRINAPLAPKTGSRSTPATTITSFSTC